MPRKRMIVVALIIMAAALVAVSFGLNRPQSHAESNSPQGSAPPQTVSQVNLPQYMGTWYEIASIPMYFQRNCAKNTKATYTLNENGTVDVLNQCTEADGEIKTAEGRAWAVEDSHNSKLKVTFLNLLGWWVPFTSGDYWIIDLDKDYQTAIIGHPERKYGWILSRTPDLAEKQLETLRQTLMHHGYDPCEFLITPQDGGRTGEEANKLLCEIECHC